MTASEQVVIPVANKQQVNPTPGDNTQNLCVVASLPSDTGNTYQGAAADVTFVLNALQLGAP